MKPSLMDAPTVRVGSVGKFVMKDLCQTCQLDYVIHNLFNCYTRSDTIVTAAKEKTFKGLLSEQHFIWIKK